MTRSLYVIGIDLGTSACKICLVDDKGRMAGEAQEGYPTHSPEPGWTEQNPADWKQAVLAATGRLLEQMRVSPSRVAGIALTSAAHIGVLLDAQGQPVRPAILWNDQRTVAEVADLEREAGDEILRATCQAVSTGWTLPHLLWVRRHDPGALNRARSVLLSKDYLLNWLTGESVTDPATAVSSQLYDVRTGTWSSRLCGLAGLDPDKLPRIAAASDRGGGLAAEAAGLLGLTAGTPVVIGTLDSATELLAAGLCEPGDSLVRLATAGGVERVVDGPTPDRHRITYPHAVSPFWYCQAGTSTCAAAVQWGMRLFADAGKGSYEEWDAGAARTPAGSEGLLFHPYLAGERAPHWDPFLRASFVGLSLSHTRGHLARAIYEGTAFSIRQAMAVLGDDSGSDRLLAVVGGGTKSSLWASILANVLGRPLRIVDDADSSYGAALIGLAGLGLSGSLRELTARRATTGHILQPDKSQQTLYTQAFAAYVRAHRQLAPFYSR